METILVTGGAGFIGSTFSRVAIEKGHSIRIVDNLSSGSREVADELQKLGAEIIIGDIRDSDVMDTALQGVDFVVHLAAQISVPLSMEYPEETADINIHGTQTVIGNALKHGAKRLVMASSAAVYGENTNLPLDEGEGGMLLSPYAESKWENEKQIFDARSKGLECVALRFFNVYGVGQRPDSAYAAVIPKFVDLLVNQQPPSINGDGLQTRDFVHVYDVVQAIFKFFEPIWVGANFHVFNVATQTRLSLLDLIDNINESLTEIDPHHSPIVPIFGPERPGDIRHSMASNARLMEEANWKQSVDFSVGVFELVKEAYLAKSQ
ncbi:MAG: LPS biosynthesis protein WbpP [Euryarchaeota archaeon]|nr:LPS biosynthesis protein WbpP [Euryarchaeota archaeon]MBJ13995.1 LPS biosynthesis protein WbpP [Euryarchaeota archaeon]|tara:strand:+ start:1465 stop:2430 length:966 start_codon:yes stop_codon:yes gene_type:complete